jgi:ligand-binding SRPBCC domain-containing protein
VTVEFVVTTEVASPIEVVFDLSLDIEDHMASMRSSGERAIAGVTAGRIGLGQEVTWRATHFRIPFTMTSRVTELDRPHRFVDEQVRGPFHAFHHEHRFAQTDDGCLMTDRVTFVAPLGPVGRLAERALLGRYIQHLIETRNAYLVHTAQNRLGNHGKESPGPDRGFGPTSSSPR